MENIEFTRFIERYLEDKMQSSERKWFEKELEGNLWLRKELELRRKADQIASNLDAVQLRKKLEMAEKRHRSSSVMANAARKVPVNYAAVFIGLIIISSLLIFTGKRANLDDYTEKALESYNLPTAQRSSSEAVADYLSEGIVLLRQGDFEGAISQFNVVLEKEAGLVQPRFYLGMAEMETEDFTGAINSFNKVIAHNDNMFIEDATYFLGLCYYQTGNTEVASMIMEGIIAGDSRYRRDAKKLLGRMK